MNKLIKERARELRKKATEAEIELWQLLRNKNFHGFKFRRQHSIGIYIVDFICITKNLIIELDGSIHFDQKNYDENRSQYLKSLGYKVIRFWNNEVLKNPEAVLEEIYRYLN